MSERSSLYEHFLTAIASLLDTVNASVFLVPIDRVTERFSRQKVFDVFLETLGDVRRKTDSGDVRRHGEARVRPEVERGHLLLVECSDIPLLHLTGTII